MKKMEYLFDSKDWHVATFFNGQLYAPMGQNVGHYLEAEGIFINMNGHYLSGIILDNRLLYKRASPYKSVNFGRCGDYGDVISYGSSKVPPEACVAYGYDYVALGV